MEKGDSVKFRSDAVNGLCSGDVWDGLMNGQDPKKIHKVSGIHPSGGIELEGFSVMQGGKAYPMIFNQNVLRKVPIGKAC